MLTHAHLVGFREAYLTCFVLFLLVGSNNMEPAAFAYYTTIHVCSFALGFALAVFGRARRT